MRRTFRFFRRQARKGDQYPFVPWRDRIAFTIEASMRRIRRLKTLREMSPTLLGALCRELFCERTCLQPQTGTLMACIPYLISPGMCV